MKFAAEATLSVDAIRFETWAAVETLRKWSSDQTPKKSPPVKGGSFGAADIDFFNKQLDIHVAKLEQIAGKWKGPESWKAQFGLSRTILLSSHASWACAVLRAYARCGQYASPELIIKTAEELSVWTPLTEAIVARWVPKPKGGFRITTASGPLRTAQCLIVRDMLSMMGIDSAFDYTRKGAGGERELVKSVTTAIEDGVNWWWCPDIRECFPSLKPGHFKWLPIYRRLLMNVVYLPKCAKIEVVKPQDHGAILRFLKVDHPDLLVPGASLQDLISVTILMVRRGLPQGSVLTPLFARAFIGRELGFAITDMNVTGVSWVDDLYLGSCDRNELAKVRQTLTERLLSNPAGPIELHYGRKLLNATGWKLIVLGYRLEPGHGYDGSSVHVKPGPKRIRRHKERLREILVAAKPGENPFEIGMNYQKCWFNSQQAWTKVPEYSKQASESITWSYIDDYLHGIKMGGYSTKEK